MCCQAPPADTCRCGPHAQVDKQVCYDGLKGLYLILNLFISYQFLMACVNLVNQITAGLAWWPIGEDGHKVLVMCMLLVGVALVTEIRLPAPSKHRHGDEEPTVGKWLYEFFQKPTAGAHVLRIFYASLMITTVVVLSATLIGMAF